MDWSDAPILEGLVTTRNADGSPHLAPMGPRILGDFERFLLRPFPTSHTYKNLLMRKAGVLHVTDDVLLLAKAAVGRADMPATRPAELVDAPIIADACRAYEFQVVTIDATQERVHIEADVVKTHLQRDYWGLNRAKHAVVEAAILTTRLYLLPRNEIDAEFRKLKVWVEKTGGPKEREAFAFVESYVAERGPA